MIVTIDGPAGAGKSSAARALAKRLEFQFLDTGAMYRAIAWAALRDGVDINDIARVAALAKGTEIRFEGERLYVDRRDVTADIRTPEVTELVKRVAGNEQVRQLLVQQQREIGSQAENLVTEGRDQGTHVFPDAECKIFLTATAEERAKRRYRELLRQGEQVTFADVLSSQNSRDASDSARQFAPLAKAPDAIEVFTDDMTHEQVVNHLVWVVETAASQGSQ